MTRMFLLHDGEDDEKNNRLQEFMDDAGLDWEGDNSGITVWIPVAAGDAILHGDDGGLRVLKKGDRVLITRHAFRWVYEAMYMVEIDSGAHHANRIHPGTVDLDTFTMPFEYGVERLVQADEALGRLFNESLGDFETFAIGEQSDQEAVVAKHSIANGGLATAHALVNDWFNGWEKPYSWEKK